MARITAEDCMDYVEDKFELVALAAKRARELEDGITPTVPRENDKSTVMALREFAKSRNDYDLDEERRQNLIESLRASYIADFRKSEIEEEGNDQVNVYVDLKSETGEYEEVFANMAFDSESISFNEDDVDIDIDIDVDLEDISGNFNNN